MSEIEIYSRSRLSDSGAFIPHLTLEKIFEDFLDLGRHISLSIVDRAVYLFLNPIKSMGLKSAKLKDQQLEPVKSNAFFDKSDSFQRYCKERSPTAIHMAFQQ